MLSPANYVQAIIATVAALSLSYGLHTCSMKIMQTKHEKAIAAERLACVTNEQKNQAITTGASNVYQSGLNQLEHDYADVMQQRSCVSVIDTGSTTSRPDAANGQGKPGNRNEVHSDKLYDFSRKCEVDRLKVIGLQKFISDERQ